MNVEVRVGPTYYYHLDCLINLVRVYCLRVLALRILTLRGMCVSCKGTVISSYITKTYQKQHLEDVEENEEGSEGSL